MSNPDIKISIDCKYNLLVIFPKNLCAPMTLIIEATFTGSPAPQVLMRVCK